VRRFGRALAAAAAILASLGLLWLAGLFWFVAASPSRIADSASPTDAIVVLTGGSLRLEQGLDLLKAGKAPALFVSGVNRAVDLGQLLRAAGRLPRPREGTIALGHDADSTIGNARETARWMHAHFFHSLRLVTGWYHMRRSLLEFARAMPGVRIVPNPVFPPDVGRDDWWQRPGTAMLIANEYDKYLAVLLRPWIDRAVPGLYPDEPKSAARE
jgi:uncharacterized SAM-binding protein YcdF (DUF218 family)